MRKKRDFLCLSDLSREELLQLLDTAARMKNGLSGSGPKQPLAGRCVGVMFEKSSTRTRVSFEVGIRQLGGHSIFLSWNDIQIGRGEPLKDTARVLSRYLDGIVVRTFGHDIVEELARWADVPLINGLTDLLHPCQVLADLFTLQEAGVDIHNMKAAWIGDGNNMANSWITAANLLGFALTLACPEGYNPAVEGRGSNVVVTRDPYEAARDADAISTDVWASMGQESEIDARKKAFRGYQVSREVLSVAREKVKVLHCLPAHRGEEITDEVMEGECSLIWDEAENRLHVQKALLAMLIP
ncbi:MAG: ornithine carbamoyltransferase [Pseudomonadota bacterium]